MIRSLRFFIVLLSILVIAQRAPAPIVEEEKPTPRPAAEQETTKHSAKPKKPRTETSEESKPAPPAKPQERFAGTWSGKINQTVWGDTPFTLTLSAGGVQVTEHSGFGTYSHSATSNGQMVTWTGGLLNEVTWTFTPSSNGSTARVTATSALGVNSDSIFRRGRTPALAKSGNEIPTAKPDPNRPGFVYNPFDPTATRLLDVRGKPSGAKVKDPSTGKMFIVP